MLTHCRVVRALKTVPLVDQEGFLIKEGDRFIEYANAPGYFYGVGYPPNGIGIPVDSRDHDYINRGFFAVESTIPTRETPYWAAVYPKLLQQMQDTKSELLQLQQRYFAFVELLNPTPAP